ncbi:ORF12 [Ranid herpesvirus 1]|uniref:ORF12 n=1 Tax=Ranid herpesvirus 1 TaxID=85655 RepID=Q14VU6_9VIRU|nr:ORF12 [Ranid herpesvirus 1]ABG25747.1 ORF12 [Ranid herpesvirus 1]
MCSRCQTGNKALPLIETVAQHTAGKCKGCDSNLIPTTAKPHHSSGIHYVHIAQNPIPSNIICEGFRFLAFHTRDVNEKQAFFFYTCMKSSVLCLTMEYTPVQLYVSRLLQREECTTTLLEKIQPIPPHSKCKATYHLLMERCLNLVPRGGADYPITQAIWLNAFLDMCGELQYTRIYLLLYLKRYGVAETPQHTTNTDLITLFQCVLCCMRGLTNSTNSLAQTLRKIVVRNQNIHHANTTELRCALQFVPLVLLLNTMFACGEQGKEELRSYCILTTTVHMLCLLQQNGLGDSHLATQLKDSACNEYHYKNATKCLDAANPYTERYIHYYTCKPFFHRHALLGLEYRLLLEATDHDLCTATETHLMCTF